MQRRTSDIIVSHSGSLTTGTIGIYQAEVRHLSHAYILLIMRLLEVVIPNISFKFGANNFNFIRVRSGQVRSGQVRSGQVRSGQVRLG